MHSDLNAMQQQHKSFKLQTTQCLSQLREHEHLSEWVVFSSCLFLSAATKVLIAPVVIVLVVVLGALALVIGNLTTHLNTTEY